MTLVSDNGPCYKSAGFARYVDSRPELTHVRTRRRSPQTNGVIERYHGAIQIEHLWRQLPADGAQMTEMVEAYRQLYNHNPTARDARRRPPDRALPRRPITRPDHTSPNAPKRANSLTRHTFCRA